MFTLKASLLESSSAIVTLNGRLNNVKKVAIDIATTITSNKVAIDEATKTNDINTIGTLFLVNSKLELKLTKSEKLVKRIREKLTRLEIRYNLPTSTDSKDKWYSMGLQEEYDTVLSIYKACKSLVELKAHFGGVLTKDDIFNFFGAYKHQITNANFLTNVGYIKNKSLVKYDRSCYSWQKNLSEEQEKEKASILAKVEDNYIECIDFILEFIQ